MIAFNRFVDIGIVSDAKFVLELLLKAIKKLIPRRESSDHVQWYKEIQKEWLGQFDEMARSNNVPIHPLRVIKEVRDFFPRDAITIVDGGNTSVWAFYLNRVYEPGTFLSSASGDSGHLGSGLAYAIAAKLAHPSKQVYCISGDGSFGFNVHELETAKRLGLNFVCIVFNDNAWGMIKAGQTLFYRKRYVGVDFTDTKYDKIAQAMGCYGERITEPSEIKPALERAVNSGLPAVLDVKIDGNIIPPDFELLAAIWLEGCETPPKVSSEEVVIE